MDRAKGAVLARGQASSNTLEIPPHEIMPRVSTESESSVGCVGGFLLNLSRTTDQPRHSLCPGIVWGGEVGSHGMELFAKQIASYGFSTFTMAENYGREPLR